jgi:hypothetical protein
MAVLASQRMAVLKPLLALIEMRWLPHFTNSADVVEVLGRFGEVAVSTASICDCTRSL